MASQFSRSLTSGVHHLHGSPLVQSTVGGESASGPTKAHGIKDLDAAVEKPHTHRVSSTIATYCGRAGVEKRYKPILSTVAVKLAAVVPSDRLFQMSNTSYFGREPGPSSLNSRVMVALPFACRFKNATASPSVGDERGLTHTWVAMAELLPAAPTVLFCTTDACRPRASWLMAIACLFVRMLVVRADCLRGSLPATKGLASMHHLDRSKWVKYNLRDIKLH